MGKRVALDADVLKLLVGRTDLARRSCAGYRVDRGALRVYFYQATPVVTPTVAAEVEQANEAVLSNWKNYQLEEIPQDDFYRGCVKGMAERYIDYHPDPRDCRLSPKWNVRRSKHS